MTTAGQGSPATPKIKRKEPGAYQLLVLDEAAVNLVEGDEVFLIPLDVRPGVAGPLGLLYRRTGTGDAVSDVVEQFVEICLVAAGPRFDRLPRCGDSLLRIIGGERERGGGGAAEAREYVSHVCARVFRVFLSP